MKLVAVFALLVGAVHCGTYGSRYEFHEVKAEVPVVAFKAPEVLVAKVEEEQKTVIPIISSQVSNDNAGNYAFNFESGNGIRQSESGHVTVMGPEEAAQVKNGEVRWISPEGQTFALSYNADENGFHVKGDHLPTPPPTPEAILRALELIRAADKAREEQHLQEELKATKK